jgi:hypothetical protein
MKQIKGISAAVAIMMLSACQQKPDEKLFSACWNPNAKQTVHSLATQIVSKHIVDSMMAEDHGKATRTDLEQLVSARLDVSLSNVYLTSADAATGIVSCGANAAMTFKGENSRVISGDNGSFSYSIYPGESGRAIYVIASGLPLVQMVDTAVASAMLDNAKRPTAQIEGDAVAASDGIAGSATAPDAASQR